MPTAMQHGRTRFHWSWLLIDPSSVSALLLDDRDAPCNSAMANWIVADLVLNRVLNRSKDSRMQYLSLSRPQFGNDSHVFDP